jgi:hypothetical protein
MTAFEVGAFFGITGGAVAGGVLCKSHGLLAIIGGVVGGASSVSSSDCFMAPLSYCFAALLQYSGS